MNICIFVGRATKDPVVRTNANGTAVASFSLAVDTGYGENRKANFFNLVAFGKAAESIDKLIRQGTKIIVQTEAQQNVWEDKEGQKHYDINFVIRSWEFAESKKTTDGQGSTLNADGYSGQSGSSGAGSYSGQAGRTTAKTEVTADPDFMNIDDDAEEDIPFS